MDILQAARQLYPGTAWVCHADENGDRILLQVEDGTPRVQVPNLSILDALVAAYIPPPTQEDRIKQLEDQISQLIAAQKVK